MEAIKKALKNLSAESVRKFGEDARQRANSNQTDAWYYHKQMLIAELCENELLRREIKILKAQTFI